MQAMILDHMRWAQLEQVQAVVNDRVRYQDDREGYGVDEFWEPAGRRGDCEDYALAKRRRLMDLGWPPEALRMATVVDERGDLHAVLTVDVTMLKGGRGTYVLDNRYADVEPWQVMRGYRWIARQGSGAYVWRYAGDPITLSITGGAMIAQAEQEDRVAVAAPPAAQTEPARPPLSDAAE